MKAKQKMATALADRYSKDFAKFYIVPGKASENPEFFRLYTFLAWKVDAFVDDFPEWKTFLGPEASECATPPPRNRTMSRDDARRTALTVRCM